MYKKFNLKGKKISDPQSLYSPSDEVKLVISKVMTDWQLGLQVQEQVRREFNDRSILGEIEVNQAAFNSYVPPKSDDPDESWKAQTVRPVTRNKLISIAAHVTGTMLYPGVFARNQEDEEDTVSAEVMKDLMEYIIDNSDYAKEFLTAVIQMLVDPFMVISEEYAEVTRKIKELKEDGTYTTKDIIDEILSGFIFNVIPAKEILFPNFYESNIQKQRFIIRNRYIEHSEAKQIYGDHENFQFVKAGVRTVFNKEDGAFYDVIDSLMQGYLDNEVTYYSRSEDLELIFINGIPVTAVDAPLRRKDKKYPFAKGGYETLGNGKSFCYKSAANKLGSDQDVVDALYNLILDGSFLAIMPPMALYGSESVDSSVTVPGSVTAFRDKDTKMESLAPRSDLRAGLEAISLVERSMSESTSDSSRSGVGSDQPGRTAREILLLDKNAETALGLFGKSIRFLVEDLGDLIIGDILQHMTVAEVVELSGTMKYKTFIMPDKNIDGKKVAKTIKFANPADFSGNPDMEWDMLNKEGGPDGKKKIYMVNPEIFRDIKFKTRVSATDLTPPNKALEKALSLEAYDRAIQNPVANQELVTRDFLFDVYRPGEGDKYIKKAQPAPAMPSALPGGAGQGQPIQQKGVNQNLVGQLTGGNSLGVSASSSMS